jgi:hypothetical protein
VTQDDLVLAGLFRDLMRGSVVSGYGSSYWVTLPGGHRMVITGEQAEVLLRVQDEVRVHGVDPGSAKV